MSDVIPAARTIKAIIIALKYSIRPCPYGCPLSAGLLASFAPMIVIKLDSTSVKLFNASSTMAIELATSPTIALNSASNMLVPIPT